MTNLTALLGAITSFTGAANIVRYTLHKHIYALLLPDVARLDEVVEHVNMCRAFLGCATSVSDMYMIVRRTYLPARSMPLVECHMALATCYMRLWTASSTERRRKLADGLKEVRSRRTMGFELVQAIEVLRVAVGEENKLHQRLSRDFFLLVNGQ